MKYSSAGVVCGFTFIYLVSKYCYCDQSGLEPEPEIQLDKIDPSITISEDIVKATPIMLG